METLKEELEKSNLKKFLFNVAEDQVKKKIVEIYYFSRKNVVLFISDFLSLNHILIQDFWKKTKNALKLICNNFLFETFGWE